MSAAICLVALTNYILTKVDHSNLPTQKVLNSLTFEVLLKDSLDFLDKNK